LHLTSSLFVRTDESARWHSKAGGELFFPVDATRDARALSPAAFGRWLIDHSASHTSAMLRQVGRSLAESEPSVRDAQAGPGSHQAVAANN
jgi:hypothetical protein